MKMIIIVLLSLTLTTISCTQSQIHLYTHSWCPPCKKVTKLFQKFQSKYPQITFIKHRFKNKTILYKTDKISNKKHKLSFPTIVFRCNSFNFTYQNDLTFNELSYWIEAICLRRIEKCDAKINQQLYHILAKGYADADVASFQGLAKIMIDYPFLRVCFDDRSNITLQRIRQIAYEMGKQPIYFDYFSHNIRNYLIKSEKLAIALITNQKNTSFVQSYLNIYFQSLKYHFIQNETQKQQTKRLYSYELKKEQAEQLLLLQLCLNMKNISQCVINEARRQQVVASQRISLTLLKYLNLDVKHLDKFQYIVAFRFRNNMFETYAYHNFGVLDERFLFWINQILNQDQNNHINRQNSEAFCIKNMISHRTTKYDLQDMETHQRLKLMVKQHNDRNALKNSFDVYKQQKLYNSLPKFSVCIQDKQEVLFNNNDELSQIQAIIKQSTLTASMDEL